LVDTVVVRAVGGPVAGIDVVVTGPNVVRVEHPAKLDPAAGPVIVAQRGQPARGGTVFGTVVVGWDEAGDRSTKVVTW
jgi:hypothetical protein